MTSGLRKLAGGRLREWLARSTRNTLSGVVTGATVTALIQSSSATTVAAIGFVGARLLTFSQSLGIIFGANIGTTITGWMVALIGFKLKLTAAALPLLFIAALCYLFNANRFLRGFGKALAGFCLIFIGISYLKDGLSQFEGSFDLVQWRAASFGGRFLLMLVGILLTLITQSSSATVATAITALNASLIDLPQAAAIIIGADIGTTGTAALATIGGSTASRRTGFAHVIYNLMTGVTAFLVLPAYFWVWNQFAPVSVADSPEVVAVSFHSVFNILGVILILPFTRQFAALIQSIFPERTAKLGASFDRGLLQDAPAALAGLEYGVREVAAETLRHAATTMATGRDAAEHSLDEVQNSISAGREFAIRLGSGAGGAGIDASRIFACIHTLDHVQRLADRVRDEERSETTRKHPELARQANEIAKILARLAIDISQGGELSSLGEIREAASDLEQDKAHFRNHTIARTAKEELTGDQLSAALDARRWLRRISYHAWRIAYHTQPHHDRK